MANRYWRGGSGTWDTTTTTNWSATSGGAGGASVPTAADSVFFDQAGTYTVTCTGALTCLDFTVSAGTVTFANGTTPTLAVSGSMSWISGTVWNSGGITFNATTTGKTISTNNVLINNSAIFNGSGGYWTLSSAFSANAIIVTAGTFDTSGSNYAITTGNTQPIIINGGTLNLNGSTLTTSFFQFTSGIVNAGSSTITVGSAAPATPWNVTGGTFNAGTSTINFNGTASVTSTFSGNNNTYYNVSLGTTGTSIVITGANTFNTLSFSARTGSIGITTATFYANQTITTLTLNAGTNATYRTFLRSDIFGTARTLTVTTLTAGAADYDFRDITIAGAASPIAPTRAGDCGGNTGITFPVAKTVYWNLAGAQNWSAIGWATSSGGTPAVNNFPLAQDTAVFDNTGSVTGTISVNAGWNIGSVDMSARTSAMTLATGTTQPLIYGNWINGSGTTLTGTGPLTFAGRGSQTITSSGKSFTQPITINSFGGTVTPQDAFTAASTSITTLTTGTLSLGSFTWTTVSFTCQGGTLAFGTGNITLTGSGTVFTGSTSTTVTGTPNVYLTYSGASSVSISPAAVTETNSINFIITAGTYNLGILASSVAVRNLDFSNGGTSTYTGSWGGSTNLLTCYGNLTLKSGMTITGTGTVTFAATSGIKTITSAGVTNTHPMTFNGVGGTWQLQDALNIGTNAITLTNGTFDANIYNVTAGRFDTNNTNTRTVNIGSGTWTLSGTGITTTTCPWLTASTLAGAASGLTVTASSGTLSFTGASTKGFGGGGLTYPTINQGGAGQLQIAAPANTFANLTNTYSSTGATSILFPTAATQTFNAFTASGASGALLSLASSTAGTQATIALSGGGTVSTDYLSVKDIAFTPGPATNGTTPYVWYLGANSTNSGNNTGGAFVASTTKVYQITNTATTSWTVPSDWNSSSNTIHLIGGGGGGGGSRATSTTNKAGGAGGGGGGYTAVTNYSTTPSSSITVAIGTGGTAGASGGGTGGTGGTTSWAVTNLATGGTGGSTTVVPTSVGGLGGTGTYSGGAGGAGSVTTTLSVAVTGGGGGGAAGPNGAGGAGGIGFANATISTTAGGGGGGNGGGTAGGNASSALGGTGGNNFLGTGGGASNTAGTLGGGGGGGVNSVGKSGGAGIDILNTIGGGGGASGTAGSAFSGVTAGFYGGGGSGASTSVSTTMATGGAGAQGLIVIAYTPLSAGGTGNFLMMF